MRKILASMRRAINDYKLISDGDKIAVGVSGGKDSLCLVTALANYKIFAPEKFELVAISIDMGYKGTSESMERIREYCSSLGVPHETVKTNIGEVVFEVRQEPNPCSLCAKMRRGALNNKAVDLGCNKVALGHHSDDVVETFFLSLFYEGRLSTFMPASYLDKTNIEVIRPLYYTHECDVTGAMRRLNLPVMKNPCPVDRHTKREEMKNLIKHICKDIPFAKDRVETALFHPERNNLLDKMDTMPRIHDRD